jgi:hypothetical protein
MIGIQRPTRPDHGTVIRAAPAIERWQNDRIVARGRQHALGLVGQPGIRQHGTRLKCQIAKGEGLDVTHVAMTHGRCLHTVEQVPGESW